MIFKKILICICMYCPLCIIARRYPYSKFAKRMNIYEARCPACRAYKEYMKYGQKKIKSERVKLAAYIILWAFLFTIIVLSSAKVHQIFNGSKSIKHEEGLNLFVDKAEYLNFVKNTEFKGVEVNIHKIKKGENYWKIAKNYGVNIDTIIGSNPYLKDLLARGGEEIVVPAKKGVLQIINSKKDCEKLAVQYGVSEQDIRKINNISTSIFEFLEADKARLVFIPDVKPKVLTKEMSDLYSIREMFISPLAGRYSSMFGLRKDPFNGEKVFHGGVDIAVPMGAQICAAAAGDILYSGWLGGYGNAIKIQHKDGYVTLYGHCSKLLAKPGKKIKRGQLIALAGSTGRSTGCHLHFTIWKDGREQNPLLFLW